MNDESRLEALIGIWNWIAWGGGAVFVGLGFLWHPFFVVAGALLGAWLITYFVFMGLGLGWMVLSRLLNVLGFEIRRKR